MSCGSCQGIGAIRQPTRKKYTCPYGYHIVQYKNGALGCRKNVRGQIVCPEGMYPVYNSATEEYEGCTSTPPSAVPYSGLGIDVPTPGGVVAVNPSQYGCGNIAGAKQMLADLGYNPGPIDNNVANLSFQKAVLQFAQSQGVDPHGQLGPSVCGPLVQAWQAAQAPVMAAAVPGQPGVEPRAEPTMPPPGVEEEEKFPTWIILAGLGVVALGIGAWYYMS